MRFNWIIVLYSDVEACRACSQLHKESGSSLITHLFKTMNCLESSDGHAAASSPGEEIPQKPGLLRTAAHADPVPGSVQL